MFIGHNLNDIVNYDILQLLVKSFQGVLPCVRLI